MHPSLSGAAAALTLSTLPVVTASAIDLDALRWRSRVLVIVAPLSGDERAERQRAALSSVGRGAGERDIVVVEAVGSGPEANLLRRRFAVPVDEFRAVLIGKDGGAKLASREPIAAATLFDTIDAMPMRQDEMRRRAAR